MSKPDIDQGGTTANMTMRQHYAGLAMQAIISKSSTAINWGMDQALAELYSRDAFRWADAMIKASKGT